MAVASILPNHCCRGLSRKADWGWGSQMPSYLLLIPPAPHLFVSLLVLADHPHKGEGKGGAS